MLSAIWCGLVLANLLWAAVITKDYSTALDRSYFQSIALFFVYLEIRK